MKYQFTSPIIQIAAVRFRNVITAFRSVDYTVSVLLIRRKRSQNINHQTDCTVELRNNIWRTPIARGQF